MEWTVKRLSMLFGVRHFEKVKGVGARITIAHDQSMIAGALHRSGYLEMRVQTSARNGGKEINLTDAGRSFVDALVTFANAEGHDAESLIASLGRAADEGEVAWDRKSDAITFRCDDGEDVRLRFNEDGSLEGVYVLD